MKPMTVAAIIVLLVATQAAVGAAQSDDSLKKRYGWLERSERPVTRAGVRYDVRLPPPAIDRLVRDVTPYVAVGALKPDSQETRSFVLPKLPDMKVVVLGNDLSWSFRCPRGEVFESGDGAHGGGAVEFGSIEMGLSGFMLQNPEPGRWTVSVASKADTALCYGITISSDGPTEEAAHLEILPPDYNPRISAVARPSDPLFVRAFVVRNGALVTGTHWEIRARTPRDSSIAIPVFDDGRHADGRAGDGVFVGAIVAEGPDGFYTFRAEGGTPGGTQYVTVGTLEIQTKNDLVMLDSLVVSPRQPKAGEPVTFMVTVMNDGVDEFKSVPLELSVDQEVVSERHVDLRPGEPRRMMMVWIPPKPGTYDVHLTLYSYDEPYWSDLSNSHRIKTVKVQ